MTPYVETGRQIESPAIMALRARIAMNFDEIDQRPELAGSVSCATFTRAFPRIKTREFNWAIEAGIIPLSRNQQRIDQTTMAILLCAKELRTMDKRLRKTAVELAREEFAKRETLRAAKRGQTRKLAFSPAI